MICVAESSSLPIVVNRSLLKSDATTNSTAAAPTNATTNAAPPTTISNIFKRVHISHHMDKSSSSPRLKLKFQHIKTKARKPSETPKTLLMKAATAGDHHYKSYSVTLADYKPRSPVDSLSSQDSDLYDPHLEFTSYGSGRHSPPNFHNHGAPGKAATSRVGGVTDSSELRASGDARTKGGSQSHARLAGEHKRDNQHMPTLSQESGPFEPHFEDISDTEADSVGDTTKTPLPSSSCSAQQHIPTSSSRLSPNLCHIGARNNVSSSNCEGGAAGERSPAPHSPPKQTVAPSPCSTVTSTRQPDVGRRNESNTSPDNVGDSSECSDARRADTSEVSPVHEGPPCTVPSASGEGDKMGPHRRKGSGSGRTEDGETSCCEPSRSDHVRSTDHEPMSECNNALELPDLESKDGITSSSHDKSSDDLLPQSPEREHREILGFVEGRPLSPKVPPLKIIMPPKATAVKAAPSSKVDVSKSKPSLPYVINPTQEAGGSAHANADDATVTADTVGEAETVSQVAPHATVSTTSEVEPEVEAMDDDSKEAAVTSTQDTVVMTRRGRHKNSEKVKCQVAEGETEKTVKDKEGKEGKEGNKKDEEAVPSERRVTRAALRSQQQQQKEQHKDQKHTGKVIVVVNIVHHGNQVILTVWSRVVCLELCILQRG